jgi:hypothetical protein
MQWWLREGLGCGPVSPDMSAMGEV